MFFLLDTCDENVGSMPYFVYLTPPAKQHRRIWVKKSHESTQMCDTAKIEHSTATPCPYFFLVSLHNHTWKGKTGQNILGYLNVVR